MLIDLPTVTSIFGSVLLCEAAYNFSSIFFIWTLLNSYASFYYHYTEERSCKKLDVYCSGISLSYIFFNLYDKEIPIYSNEIIPILLAFFYLGRSWTNCRPRRNGYTINHSLFHIFISVGMRGIINKFSE
jgi:hypothetical protein